MIGSCSIMEEDLLLDNFKVTTMEENCITSTTQHNKFSSGQTDSRRVVTSEEGYGERIDPLLDSEYVPEGLRDDIFESPMPMYDGKELTASLSASVFSYSSISSSDTFFGSTSFFDTDFFLGDTIRKDKKGRSDSLLEHSVHGHGADDQDVVLSMSRVDRTSISDVTDSAYVLDDSIVKSTIDSSDMLITQTQSVDDLQPGQFVDPFSNSNNYLSFISGNSLDVGLEPSEKKNSEHGYSSLESSDIEELKYKHVQRQRRYSKKASTSPCALSNQNKKVSDSRLSAQGLAEVLKLDSAEEALRRERFILDIFENELHYPLGYKTWVRDTNKEYRRRLLNELHERVKTKYPEYDQNVLETIIRRATYYMMQSRLRRERRAKAKAQRNSSNAIVSKSLSEQTISSSREVSNANTSHHAYGPKSFGTGTSFMM